MHTLVLADKTTTTITATTTSDQKVTDIIPSPTVPATISSTGEMAITSWALPNLRCAVRSLLACKVGSCVWFQHDVTLGLAILILMCIYLPSVLISWFSNVLLGCCVSCGVCIEISKPPSECTAKYMQKKTNTVRACMYSLIYIYNNWIKLHSKIFMLSVYMTSVTERLNALEEDESWVLTIVLSFYPPIIYLLVGCISCYYRVSGLCPQFSH